MATPVEMPKPGNTVEECLITEWLVEEGAAVSTGDILCNIESDKAAFEVESPAAGTLLKRFFADGDLVPVLTNIGAIGDAGEDVSALEGTVSADASDGADAAPATADEAPVAAPSAAPGPAPQPAAGGEQRISPRARQVAVAKGVDAAALAGTGPHGRVTSRDVETAAQSGARLTPLAQDVSAAGGVTPVAATGLGGRVRARDLGTPTAASPGAATPAPAVAGEIEEIPYRGIRQIIGDRMATSLVNHAQLTMNRGADASALLALRKKFKAAREADGSYPNITLNDMVAYVVAQNLPRFPAVNGIFEKASGKLQMYRDAHLAIAVDTERGLMVPVMRAAQHLRLGELSTCFADLVGQCRGGAIDPENLQGGTFTISNLGTLGVQSFTPILNTPQVAILGVCSIEKVPAPDGAGGVKFVPTLGLSLTIDHQVVDGAPAARFLKAVADGIANFEVTLAG